MPELPERRGKGCNIRAEEFIKVYEHPGAHATVIPIYKPFGRARARFFAIHGPGGSWWKTWSRGSSDELDEENFWLWKVLPSHFPDCAIYSIAYNDPGWHDVGPGRAVRKEIHKHFEKTPVVERAPFVFIAGRIGGLYLMELITKLYKERDEERDEERLSCTPQLEQLRAVLLLDTPQRFETVSYPIEPVQDVLCLHDKKLTQRFKELPESFKRLGSDMKFEIKYANNSLLPRPRYSLSDRNISLGSYLYAENTDLVPSLKGFFRQETQGILTDILDHNPDWDMIQFSFHDGSKPDPELEYNPLDYDPRNNSNYLKFSDLAESWLHIPLNNEEWMKEMIEHLTQPRTSSQSKKGLHDKAPRWLGLTQKARSDVAHSRYVLPMCEVPIKYFESDIRQTEFQIAIPYIHWDTRQSNRMYVEDTLEAARDNWDQNINLGGIRGMRRSDASSSHYHPRRTLDQFAFPHLRNTKKRDDSQVVSKLTGEEADLRGKGGARIIMVDQLWIHLMVEEYLPKEAEPVYLKSCVISSFPHTSYVRQATDPDSLYDAVDIRQNILEEMERQCFERLEESREMGKGRKSDSITQELKMHGPEVASLILTSALLGILSQRNRWELEFLNVFEEHIGNITEQHNDIFDFTARLASGQRRTNVTEQRTKELQQNLEISDVIDELGMLQQLFRNQLEVLSKAFKRLDKRNCLKPLQAGIQSIIRKIEDEYEPKVRNMMKESERLRKSITNLLDILQNEASIDEARYANQQSLFAAKQVMTSQDQADSAQLQSKILFVFTFVTILFLPLGFITSYYGMNIIDILDPDGGTKAMNYAISDVSKVMAAVTICITTVFVIGAWLWYEKGRKDTQKKNTKYLVKLEDRGYLPHDLLDEDSDERKRMTKYRRKEAETLARNRRGKLQRFLGRNRERNQPPGEEPREEQEPGVTIA